MKKSRKVAFKHSSCLRASSEVLSGCATVDITATVEGAARQALVLCCPSRLHHELCFRTSDRWTLQRARHVQSPETRRLIGQVFPIIGILSQVLHLANTTPITTQCSFTKDLKPTSFHLDFCHSCQCLSEHPKPVSPATRSPAGGETESSRTCKLEQTTISTPRS